MRCGRDEGGKVDGGQEEGSRGGGEGGRLRREVSSFQSRNIRAAKGVMQTFVGHPDPSKGFKHEGRALEGGEGEEESRSRLESLLRPFPGRRIQNKPQPDGDVSRSRPDEGHSRANRRRG